MNWSRYPGTSRSTGVWRSHCSLVVGWGHRQSIDFGLFSFLDLGATKDEVVQARAEGKDYLDIDALLARTHHTLPDMLVAAAAVFGPQFNAQISLKALSHFADVAGGVQTDVQARLALAARLVDLDLLPVIDPITEIEP